MIKAKENYIKLAIQKSGRLSEDSLHLLHSSGLEFESYKRKLFVTCRNFPLEILYVRDDDIPDLISSGFADIGIIGENVFLERKNDAKKILEFNFGFCSLAIAVPKESNIKTLDDLRGKTIATSYVSITKKFFAQNKIPIKIVEITGAVEITPAVGIASAIVDIVSTGSTLATNDLKVFKRILESKAILIANKKSIHNALKRDLMEKLMMRFKGVMSATNYKYIMMNAPENKLEEIKKLIPGLKSPTISPLADKGWISIQTVIQEEVFWQTIEKLKQIGAQGIIVLPLEKMIH